MRLKKLVAVITGGNSGIGFAIAQRLAQRVSAYNSTSNVETRSHIKSHSTCRIDFEPEIEYDELVLVLACRNINRAERAKNKLLGLFGNKNITVDLIELDTSDTSSVLSASFEISQKYEYVNLLFCNAGVLPAKGLNWKKIIKGLFIQPMIFLESSEALVQESRTLTREGLGLTFATNFFGHYLLIKRLMTVIGKAPSVKRVIWTGSAASNLDFDKNDYQHLRGEKPYESSKYVTDQISVMLDSTILKPLNIRSLVIEPGNVSSNILSILGNGVYYLVYALFVLLRLVFGISRLTIDPLNGAYSAYKVAVAEDVDENSKLKYYSQCTRLGSCFTISKAIKYDRDLAEFLIKEFDQLIVYTIGKQ